MRQRNNQRSAVITDVLGVDPASVPCNSRCVAECRDEVYGQECVLCDDVVTYRVILEMTLSMVVRVIENNGWEVMYDYYT